MSNSKFDWNTIVIVGVMLLGFYFISQSSQSSKTFQDSNRVQPTTVQNYQPVVYPTTYQQIETSCPRGCTTPPT